MTSIDKLAILQYNLNRAKLRVHSLLNDPTSADYAILMLQEQYWSQYTESSLMHHSWMLIEAPRGPQGGKPRSAIYINNKIIQTRDFEIKPMPFKDVTAVAITTNQYRKPILLVNIYNPHDKDLITLLRHHLRKTIHPQQYSAIIALGDFNLHHPLWNPPNYQVQDEKAEDLIQLMAEMGLKILSPEGMITYPRAGTAIDLVWGNSMAEQILLHCRVAEHNDHGSDHLPIETALDLTPHRTACSTPIPNLQKADWELMANKIKTYLPPLNMHTIQTAEELDALSAETTNAIARAIQESAPPRQPSPFSKRWWTEELTRIRAEVNYMRNRYRHTQSPAYKREWKRMKNEYKRKIKQAKDKTWRKFTGAADATTIWKVKDYLTATPSQPFIPTLDGTAANNQQKARKLESIFFPEAPEADLTDLTIDYTYPVPVPCNTSVTEQQVERAIFKPAPDKAPGMDGITNRVLQ